MSDPEETRAAPTRVSQGRPRPLQHVVLRRRPPRTPRAPRPEAGPRASAPCGRATYFTKASRRTRFRGSSPFAPAVEGPTHVVWASTGATPARFYTETAGPQSLRSESKTVLGERGGGVGFPGRSEEIHRGVARKPPKPGARVVRAATSRDARSGPTLETRLPGGLEGPVAGAAGSRRHPKDRPRRRNRHGLHHNAIPNAPRSGLRDAPWRPLRHNNMSTPLRGSAAGGRPSPTLENSSSPPKPLDTHSELVPESPGNSSPARLWRGLLALPDHILSKESSYSVKRWAKRVGLFASRRLERLARVLE